MIPFKKGKKKKVIRNWSHFSLFIFLQKPQYICTCTCFFYLEKRKRKIKKEHQLPKFFTKMTDLHLGLQQYVLICAQTQKTLLAKPMDYPFSNFQFWTMRLGGIFFFFSFCTNFVKHCLDNQVQSKAQKSPSWHCGLSHSSTGKHIIIHRHKDLQNAIS